MNIYQVNKDFLPFVKSSLSPILCSAAVCFFQSFFTSFFQIILVASYHRRCLPLISLRMFGQVHCPIEAQIRLPPASNLLSHDLQTKGRHLKSLPALVDINKYKHNTNQLRSKLPQTNLSMPGPRTTSPGSCSDSCFQ